MVALCLVAGWVLLITLSREKKNFSARVTQTRRSQLGDVVDRWGGRPDGVLLLRDGADGAAAQPVRG